ATNRVVGIWGINHDVRENYLSGCNGGCVLGFGLGVEGIRPRHTVKGGRIEKAPQREADLPDTGVLVRIVAVAHVHQPHRQVRSFLIEHVQFVIVGYAVISRVVTPPLSTVCRSYTSAVHVSPT